MAVVVQQIGRDLRTDQIQGVSGSSGNSNGSQAILKQLAFLEKLGVSFEEGISKQKASELIDEAVASE